MSRSVLKVALTFALLTTLSPQIGQAACPGDWWCSPPPATSTSNNPWNFSPGFDLVICFDQACVNNQGLSSSGLPTPKVTVESSLGCTTGTNVTLSGNAICAASTDGVLDKNSAAQCLVDIMLPSVTCNVGTGNTVTYSKSQSAKQDPQEVFDPASKVTIKVRDDGPTGWPCPNKDASTGQCIADFFFTIGTEFCSSFNGCVAKIYPATGGTNFDSLNAGQVLKGVESQNFLALRGCKSAADSTTVICQEKGKVLTGGGEASVGVKCPQGDWAGNRTDIGPNAGNNGFDIFPDADCILQNIKPTTVRLNGVLNQGFQLQEGGSRFRFFFDEGAVYAASGCTSGLQTLLVATGDIDVPQGTGTVTVPFFTDPGDPVTCK